MPAKQNIVVAYDLLFNILMKPEVFSFLFKLKFLLVFPFLYTTVSANNCLFIYENNSIANVAPVQSYFSQFHSRIETSFNHFLSEVKIDDKTMYKRLEHKLFQLLSYTDRIDLNYNEYNGLKLFFGSKGFKTINPFTFELIQKTISKNDFVDLLEKIKRINKEETEKLTSREFLVYILYQNLTDIIKALSYEQIKTLFQKTNAKQIFKLPTLITDLMDNYITANTSFYKKMTPDEANEKIKKIYFLFYQLNINSTADIILNAKYLNILGSQNTLENRYKSLIDYGSSASLNKNEMYKVNLIRSILVNNRIHQIDSSEFNTISDFIGAFIYENKTDFINGPAVTYPTGIYLNIYSKIGEIKNGSSVNILNASEKEILVKLFKFKENEIISSVLLKNFDRFKMLLTSYHNLHLVLNKLRSDAKDSKEISSNISESLTLNKQQKTLPFDISDHQISGIDPKENDFIHQIKKLLESNYSQNIITLDGKNFSIEKLLSWTLSNNISQKELDKILIAGFGFKKEALVEIDLTDRDQVKILDFFLSKKKPSEVSIDNIYLFMEQELFFRIPKNIPKSHINRVLAKTVSLQMTKELTSLFRLKPNLSLIDIYQLEKALNVLFQIKRLLVFFTNHIGIDKLSSNSVVELLELEINTKIFSISEITDRQSPFNLKLIKYFFQEFSKEKSKGGRFDYTYFKKSLVEIYGINLVNFLFKKFEKENILNTTRSEWNIPPKKYAKNYFQNQLSTDKYNSLLNHPGVLVRYAQMSEYIKNFRTMNKRMPTTEEALNGFKSLLGYSVFYRAELMTKKEFQRIKEQGAGLTSYFYKTKGDSHEFAIQQLEKNDLLMIVINQAAS